jgi:hypothetical protein
MGALLHSLLERVARRQQNARPDLNGGGQYYRLIITSKNEPKPEL